jgi:hypothetical protein
MQATVKVTGMWKQTQERENDSADMETIAASGMFKPVHTIFGGCGGWYTSDIWVVAWYFLV